MHFIVEIVQKWPQHDHQNIKYYTYPRDYKLFHGSTELNMNFLLLIKIKCFKNTLALNANMHLSR